MTETEPKPNPEADMQKSVEILTSLNNCDCFEQDEEDEGRISLSNYAPGTGNLTSRKYYSIEDFYRAVDYYYQNRMVEFCVNQQMCKPGGVVDVYSLYAGNGAPRRVVVSLTNYKVPQILEFAYLLLREDQKNSFDK